jgi:hypothetical protein
MSAPSYTPGTITVVLRDGRRFVYPADIAPAAAVLDLRAQGVQPTDIVKTVHVIRRGSDGPSQVVAVDHAGGR